MMPKRWILAIAATLFLLASGPVRAQGPPPVSCTAQAAGTPSLRGNSQSEATGEVLVICTGGNPIPNGQTMPLVNFQIAFNSAVAPKLLAGNWTESLLFIDEPANTAFFPCEQPSGSCTGWGNGLGSGYYGGGPQSPATPNVRNIYQGQLVSANAIAWLGVPFDPPGTGATRTFRFTNLKLNAVELFASGAGTPAIALVSVNPASIPILNPSFSVGVVQPPQTGTVRDAGSANAAPGGVPITTAVAGTAVRIATLRFTETQPTGFRRRTVATSTNPDISPPPANQDVLGLPSSTETGFYNGQLIDLSGVGRGNLAVAGLADHGIRMRANFSNVPAGVTLFAALYNDSPQPLGTRPELARLIATDTAGAGPFSPLPGAGMAQIPVNQGTGAAVWEVLRTDNTTITNMEFGIFASYPAGFTGTPIQVALDAAPVSAITGASRSAPHPRFAGGAGALPFATFNAPAGPPVGEPSPLPTITANPAVMRFTAVEGQSPAPQILTVTSQPGPLSYSLLPEPFFPMTLSKTAGTTPDRISVAPDTGKLGPGTFRQFIRVLSQEASNSPVLVQVELVVTPGLRLSSVDPLCIAPGGNGFALSASGLNIPPRSFLRWNAEALPTTGSGNQLVAQVPSRLYTQPGTAQITIQAPDGTVSNALPFTVAPPVEITSLSPNPVSTSSSGFDLTITGSGFAPGATVQVGGVSVTPKSVTGTGIVVTIPANLIARPGEISLTVSNPDKCSPSRTVTLTVLPPPSITRVDLPCFDAGTTNAATISGANFTRDSKVQVNGQTVPTTFGSASSLSAQIPGSMLAGLRSVTITVISADGVSSAPLTIPVCEPVGVTSAGVAAGDTNAIIVVRGSGFQPGSRVQVKRDDGQEATLDPLSLTPGEIRVQLPPALLDRPSTIQVRVIPPTGPPSSSAPVPVNPAPRITSLSEMAPPVGGAAFLLTVTGTNLLDGSQVFWNNRGLDTRFSGGQLIASVPADLLTTPGLVNISATGPGGARTNILALSVTLPALSGVNYTGPAASTSAQVVEVAFALAAQYPVPVRVRLTAGFVPSGQLPDDPLVQFSNGQRQIDVTIPANSTAPARAMLQTGATAGAISITPQFFADTTGITPPGTQVRTITIPPGAPTLVTVDCVRTSATQLTVTADGLTNTREARQGSFGFTAAAGESISGGQIPIDVAALFNTWFASAPSRAQGGNFRYTQIFNIQGSSSGVAGVSLSLTNQVGASTTVNANCRQP